MGSSDRGFTLIELIVVIIILGILSATALPKFINLSGDARAAALQGVDGALKGASNMVYGMAAARGRASMASTLLPSVIGATGVSIIFGYPATASHAAVLLDLTAGVYSIGTTNTIRVNAAPTPTACQIIYTPATATTAATTAITTSGC